MSVELNTLAPGDIIWTKICIHLGDLAYKHAQSETSKKIKDREPIDRICVVLETNETSVQVTYFSTFHEANDLPPTLDKDLWYPVQPAIQEGRYEPLPGWNVYEERAQWASLRQKHKVTQQKVYKFKETLPADSVNAILRQMKA
ncbi:hypothetical protein F5J12DRAFT_150524 [Pisolithus orientalis]|uniref:uncharacterized protein n=1 Tax=Pisolithus orientalis TaxID=936130 RepID=UPI0022243AAD|nr:uncharacterized protein F5J12DRAFT_150524 [Pisolithus orientalis]KAI5983081.1 hypothetical protein F5J12DRAFT_150524 [Pisolithus orientalis]